MDAATTEHIISQVGRVLDAEVAYRNRQMGQAMTTVAHIRRALLPPNTLEPEKSPMSILGLESGAFQAKLAEIRKRAADGRAAGLTKMDGAVTAGLAKIDAAAEVVVAKVDKEIEAQVGEFAAFGDNGGEA